MPRYTITTPIFYVNAPPHIGHAYTVVAADVLARAHRLHGEDVFFLTGTDEHGTKISEAAAAADKEPQAFSDEVAGVFRYAWKALDVRYDDFIRTTEPRHVAGVQHALRVLHQRGHVYEKPYHGLYCPGCENFLTEKDLNGEGKCPLHNRKPTVVEEKNWFFKLSAFLPEVRAHIERDELRIAPVERKNEVLGLFKGSDLDGGRSDPGARQGIVDFSISRPKDRVPWAVPLPFDETQTCYVWVDALLNYVTALGYGETRNEKRGTSDKYHEPHSSFLIPHPSRLCRYWPADLHLVGLDILKFHAVYWPALLLALDLPLPKEIFVHGFFTVNGQKISKSLGNAIDPLALVQRYGSDATRFLLLSQFPFGASGDVQAGRFDEQYDAVLANTIGNLVSRVIALLQKFSDSKIPDAPADRTFSRTLLAAKKSVDEATTTSDFLDALVREPVHLAQALNQYADHAAPWKETDPAKRATALRTLADGIVTLALLAEPLLPRTSAAIQHAFGVSDRPHPAPGTRAHLPREALKERSGVRPTDPSVLFPRANASEKKEGS